MFVWKLWGDVWQIGDGQDYLTHLIVSLIVSVFLLMLTAVVIVAVIAPVYVYRGFQALAASSEGPQLLPPQAVANSPATNVPVVASCPSCGNTKSVDIQPCIKCGEWT